MPKIWTSEGWVALTSSGNDAQVSGLTGSQLTSAILEKFPPEPGSTPPNTEEDGYTEDPWDSKYADQYIDLRGELEQLLDDEPYLTFEDLRFEWNLRTEEEVVQEIRDQRLLSISRDREWGAEYIFPSAQFNEARQPIRSLIESFGILQTAGMEELSLWLWMLTPDGRLSGETPAGLSLSDSQRVVTSAKVLADTISWNSGENS